MKITGDIKSAKNSKAVGFSLTDEVREKWMKIADKIVDILMRETSGPAEARMVLQHIANALDESYGIKAVIIQERGDSEA